MTSDMCLVMVADMLTNRLKSQDGTHISTDALLLQQKLESITSRNAKLEAEYLEILQDKLGLETAIEDLREPSREPEETLPFLEQRKKLQATQNELSELKTRHFSLTSELASIKERLLAVEKDRGNGTLDSDTEYHSLTERYAELKDHSEGVDVELAEQRALLRHSLLNLSALSRDPAEIRNSNEYKIIVQQLEAVQEANEEESDILESTATELADKIESARAESSSAIKVSLPPIAPSFDPLNFPLSVPKRKPARLPRSGETLLKLPRYNKHQQETMQHYSVKINS